MTQYPGFEIERFEYEGGRCYYPQKEPTDLEMEEILLGDDANARKENEKHKEQKAVRET